jgi:hypothetical protein
MSTSFVVTLIAVAAALLLLRWAVPALPDERVTRRLTVPDLVLTLLGVLGLILHCASMFFRPLVAAVPGTEGVINQINSMGVASMIWYAIPSLLLLIGLRRQHWIGLVPLTASLLAVGITMYDGSALSTHLATIFIAGVMIAAVLFLLSTPPWARPAPSTAAKTIP